MLRSVCVHAATHTNNEISLPQDNTVMHAWPDSVALTASPAESYTPNNCYRGKLHVPCVPLRNSAVTLLSLARNHYGLRIIRASFFLQRTCAALSRAIQMLSAITIRSIIDASEIESSRESRATTTRVIANAICMHYIGAEQIWIYPAWCMYLDELHVQNDNSV